MRPLITNVVDVIGEVVAKVNTKLLPSLQAKYPNGINYQYGTVEEVVTLLANWSGGTYDAKKYPLFWLLVNFPEDETGTIGMDKDVQLTIIIATVNSDQSMSTKDRYETNFNPTLLPIYDEFIWQLRYTKEFYLANSTRPKHRKVIEAYWGREGILGRDNKNIFTDKVDAILITNLQLTLKEITCRT